MEQHGVCPRASRVKKALGRLAPAIPASLLAIALPAAADTQGTASTALHTANGLDYTVVGLYLLIMLALGVAFRSLNRNSIDYFRSGSRSLWWMVGSSAFMTAFSAWTFTGAASAAYTAGISIASIFIANTVGFFINAAIFAPWFRQTRATTLPEVLRARFDVPTQQVYAWLGVLFSYLMAGLHLWGVSIFASTLFGFNLQLTIIGLGAVVVLYSTIGGSWSVMATDFIQTLILIPLTIVVTILALIKVGGFGGMLTKMQDMGLDRHLHFIESGPTAKFTLVYIIAICIKQVMVYNGLNNAPKYFSVKDGNEARKAAILSGVLMLTGSLFWFVPPIVARISFADIVESIPLKNPSEAAYAVTSVQLLPAGLIGLMAVAMLAATMSSMDSSLNRNAAVFTRDIVKGLLFKNISEKAQFIVGQLFTLVCGVIVIGLSLYFATVGGKGIFDMMMQLGGLVAIPKLVPMLWALFVKRAPRWSALAAVGAGFVMSIVATVGQWEFPAIIFTNFGVGTVVFFAVSYLWPAKGPYREQVDAFFARMHTPVDFEREIGGAVDLLQLRIIGGVALLISVLLLGLLFMPGSYERWPIVFVSVFIGLVGAGFIATSFRQPKTPVPEAADALSADVPAEVAAVAQGEHA